MPEILSPERVAEYAKLAEQATEGPWDDLINGFCLSAGVGSPKYEQHHADICLPPECPKDDKRSRANAAFIARAREAVPELCASHEALRKRVAELEKAKAEYESLKNNALLAAGVIEMQAKELERARKDKAAVVTAASDFAHTLWRITQGR